MVPTKLTSPESVLDGRWATLRVSILGDDHAYLTHRVLRGFGVSAAASPTSSVPAKENAAVTNTAHTPLNPFARAPGFSQYRPPTSVAFFC